MWEYRYRKNCGNCGKIAGKLRGKLRENCGENAVYLREIAVGTKKNLVSLTVDREKGAKNYK
jgi:hypothetical protein